MIGECLVDIDFKRKERGLSSKRGTGLISGTMKGKISPNLDQKKPWWGWDSWDLGWTLFSTISKDPFFLFATYISFGVLFPVYGKAKQGKFLFRKGIELGNVKMERSGGRYREIRKAFLHSFFPSFLQENYYHLLKYPQNIFSVPVDLLACLCWIMAVNRPHGRLQHV